MATIRNSVPGAGYGNVYVDSLIWGGTAWNSSVEPIKVYFGQSGDFAAARARHGESEVLTSAAQADDWITTEIDIFDYAAAVYGSVCGLRFQLVDTVSAADIVWWKTALDGSTLGLHELPANGQVWGYFDPSTPSWSNMHFGGDGLNTVLHELGHGLGLAHPHDGGDEGGTSFPGVTDSSSTGTYGLNQGIWTIMSYNTGWDRAGYDVSYGNQGGLGAFDIAALQALYGKNMATGAGKDVYTLPTWNLLTEEQGWFCIWDAGGTDTITAANALAGVQIDLRAATLRAGDRNAGGFISREAGVAGGYTIANGVVIENATGGRSNDKLYGNAAANTLKGNGGKDSLLGQSGNDILMGGLGADTLSGGSGSDAFVFNTKPNKTTNLDRITDFNVRYDVIRLENSIFKKIGKTGTLSSKHFEVGTKAGDGDDYIVYNKSKGILYYDADGSGQGRAVEIAILSNKAKMTVADIIVI
ncbi:M10 family metallopeptidase C-terminal domain-containing protein [Microvirga terrestris]|uniref:M10 family metallopeptidase C-terminal domain-containing protein n=1 Tax=Microvirga terrestris TaxID=2791024 RepID=A0ABS0HPP1_9HYPH|nr:M10 family metallopeptidase C-terminal domain-containing protein [Microvirga terrestris]MBF9195447.1 M10 family metallopeptidase C-terminal domain-containing protein [Microvirga terrestris]